ncbi:MAG: AraC family transcriptional regulator [Bacteroidota bacterium]
MRAQIDVRHNILEQFARQLGVLPGNDRLHVDTSVGQGQIRLVRLPGQMELYHFQVLLKESFEIASRNPADSDWLLVNINLSEKEIAKTVNNQALSIQKHLPSGMLLYTPETEVYSVSPPDVPFSIVLLRFHRSLLDRYPNEYLNTATTSGAAIIYEDLDAQSERLLHNAVKPEENMLIVHAHVLEVLGRFFEKLRSREVQSHSERLHPADLKGLFMACARLRDPFDNELPSVDELSRIAGMGTTKFNTSFKQVFGTTPLRYNLKIKMEYARDQLSQKLNSPSEISYQLGYSHPSKFTAAFKREFGVLPSEV